MAVHFFDNKTPSLVVKRFAANRHLLQARKHKTGKSFEAIVDGKFQIVLGFEVANVDGSVEHERRVHVGDRRLGSGYVEFILQFANQLLEHVFDADHSSGRAEFIDDHSQAALALLELAEQI